MPPSSVAKSFEAFARSCDVEAPATAAVLRRCAHDSVALKLLPAEPTWDVPHRMLAAVRLLVSRGEAEDFEDAPDPWAAFRAVLVERDEWIARFVREQPVQTHAVQRCWVLLPLFLTIARIARKPLDLIELGPSGGLNLLWDRYFYRYQAGTWGETGSGVSLTGDERAPIPQDLLETKVEVRRRRGIDLNPVDVTSVEGMRLLRAFRKDESYGTLLDSAAKVLRREPPELIQGNYLDILPDLLRQRDGGSLTVVFQTHSTVYLTDDERQRLRMIIDSAGSDAPLGWISTPTNEEHGERRGDYPLELAVWPDAGQRIVARTGVRATWLDWYNLPERR